MGAGTVVDNAATTSLEVAPGTRWKYANNDTMLVMRALRASFDSTDEFRRVALTEWPVAGRASATEQLAGIH